MRSETGYLSGDCNILGVTSFSKNLSLVLVMEGRFHSSQFESERISNASRFICCPHTLPTADTDHSLGVKCGYSKYILFNWSVV
jgi:hypothetical protein